MTDQTERDRIITALYDARRPGLGGMTEAQAVGFMADAVVAALARAHQPAGQAPATDRAGLRDRIRRAVCEAEGFAWDSDMLEPDEYGEVADMVLSVLPANTGLAEVAKQIDLRDYWHAEAMSATTRIIELEGQLEESRRAAVVPADRAAVLREAADAVAADTAFHIRYGSAIDYATRYADLLRRMADEAQQPEACGRTVSVSGQEYPPCARPPGHREAYCRSADGRSHSISVVAAPPAVEAQQPKDARS